MEPRHALKRRGILAAAGAVVAGIAVRQAAHPVAAANNDPLTAGNAFSETASFFLTNTTGTVTPPLTSSPGTAAVFRGADGSDAVRGLCYGPTSGGDAGIGVFGVSNAQGIGVVGTSDTGSSFLPRNVGVYGQGATFTDSIGVFGQVLGGSTGTGVSGDADIGVSGTGNTGVRGTGGIFGVSGVIASSTSRANTVATQGINGSTGTGGVGIYDRSVAGYGVIGYSTGGAASISGISTNINIPAFAGGTSVQNGLAAHFTGTVYVDCATEGGRFVVNPMAAKSGLLKHPDGTHRLMYCMEAPESWAEDFGTGALTAGNAEVKLDPDFAALIEPDYHVFVTPRDAACRGLAVAAQRADGFTVRELNGGASSGAFSYRVVARPKSDRKVERLAKFAIPHVTYPDPSALTKPPAPTKRP